MWSPNEAFLGVRVPKELATQLTQAAEKINKHEGNYWNRLNKSKLAREILEAFFSSGPQKLTELRKRLDKAAGSKNVKRAAGRRSV